METFTHDGMTFRVRDGGPSDAPEERTVVLLHGFPQTSAAWSDVSDRLHAQGLRTLAPDTRGIAPSARPARREEYRIDRLVSDVVGLLDAAGLDAVHLVGHDWGGAIAWAFVRRHPDRVRSLTVLSTPHPGAMAWAMRHSTQGLKSWYMLPLLVPAVPELAIGWGLRRFGMAGLGLPKEQEREYVDALTTFGALGGAIGPYRGMTTRRRRSAGASESSSSSSPSSSPSSPSSAPSTGPRRSGRGVAVPTTYVWGRHDAYLGRAAAERTGSHCTGDYRFVEVDADHWLPEKQSELVAREIASRVLGTVD